MDKELLITLLERHNIKPDSDLKDQHFMVCEEVISKVVDVADISIEDYVLEIGPGPGQLTQEILKRGAHLTIIEIDKRFEGILKSLQNKLEDRLQIIWGSALDIEWPGYINKIVMNPPYSILEPLLEKMYLHSEIECVSMVIGNKYCQNASTRPGNRGFTKTSLMTQAKFEPHFVMEVNKECFYPEEGERSAIMYLTLKERPHPILTKLADFFTSNPQINAGFVIQQALELINKRAKKHKNYEKLITVGKLNINPALLNKRLQDLTNNDIELIVSKLTSQFNFQRSEKRININSLANS